MTIDMVAKATFTPGNTVTHPRHGQGEVRSNCGLTTVVRFAHGLEEVCTDELKAVFGLNAAVTSGVVSPASEVILRAQAGHSICERHLGRFFQITHIVVAPSIVGVPPHLACLAYSQAGGR